MEPVRRRGYNLLHAIVFKARGLALVPPLVLLVLCRRWEIESEWAIWGAGLPVFLAGTVLRVWAQRHLSYRLRTDPRLAVTGPYAYVRNPVYIGNALIVAGLAVMCELPWAVPLLVLWASIVYSLAVRFEEARLLKRYGEQYERYLHRVPRWVPAIPALLESWPDGARAVSWATAGRAEWQCSLLLLLPGAKELISHGCGS